MDKLEVRQSIWIAAPRESVWQAVTDAQQLEQWFSPGSPWEIAALEVGGKAIWHSSEEAADLHTIEVVDPPHQFTLRWEPEPPYTPRVTTYLLDEEEGGTRVTIIETGFELLPADTQQEDMERTANGYTTMLADLKSYVEGKKPTAKS